MLLRAQQQQQQHPQLRQLQHHLPHLQQRWWQGVQQRRMAAPCQPAQKKRQLALHSAQQQGQPQRKPQGWPWLQMKKGLAARALLLLLLPALLLPLHLLLHPEGQQKQQLLLQLAQKRKRLKPRPLPCWREVGQQPPLQGQGGRQQQPLQQRLVERRLQWQWPAHC